MLCAPGPNPRPAQTGAHAGPRVSAQRWNEARTLWGGVINTCRNVVRQSNQYFPASAEGDQLRTRLMANTAAYSKARCSTPLPHPPASPPAAYLPTSSRARRRSATSCAGRTTTRCSRATCTSSPSRARSRARRPTRAWRRPTGRCSASTRCRPWCGRRSSTRSTRRATSRDLPPDLPPDPPPDLHPILHPPPDQHPIRRAAASITTIPFLAPPPALRAPGAPGRVDHQARRPHGRVRAHLQVADPARLHAPLVPLPHVLQHPAAPRHLARHGRVLEPLGALAPSPPPSPAAYLPHALRPCPLHTPPVPISAADPLLQSQVTLPTSVAIALFLFGIEEIGVQAPPPPPPRHRPLAFATAPVPVPLSLHPNLRVIACLLATPLVAADLPLPRSRSPSPSCPSRPSATARSPRTWPR